jgi:hypothetical protein
MGNSGLIVSRLSFGAMTFTLGNWFIDLTADQALGNALGAAED